MRVEPLDISTFLPNEPLQQSHPQNPVGAYPVVGYPAPAFTLPTTFYSNFQYCGFEGSTYGACDVSQSLAQLEADLASFMAYSI